MSASTRVDTVSLIPGACVVGVRGLGVSGAALRAATAAGDHGPGILFNDWDSGDDAKEFRAFVSTPPAQGDLTVFEDGSFIWSGLPDGAHSFSYELFVDGVSQGAATATATIGSVAQAESGGAPAVVRVSAAGQGVATEQAQGGSSAVVRVIASGAGQSSEDQGGTGATAAQVASAVRAELALELSLLMDLARIHGLVYSDPLTVTPTSRNAGTVSQTIGTNGDQVTVQRA